MVAWWATFYYFLSSNAIASAKTDVGLDNAYGSAYYGSER